MNWEARGAGPAEHVQWSFREGLTGEWLTTDPTQAGLWLALALAPRAGAAAVGSTQELLAGARTGWLGSVTRGGSAKGSAGVQGLVDQCQPGAFLLAGRAVLLERCLQPPRLGVSAQEAPPAADAASESTCDRVPAPLKRQPHGLREDTRTPGTLFITPCGGG